MKPRANETLTGLFVLITLLLVAAVIVYLSAPGIVRKQNTYYVFFDNAGGIQTGTDVLLAGRHVGQVVGIESPVPMNRRPEGHKDLECLVEVHVAKDAHIYNDVIVRLIPYGMLGEMLVDFVKGDETTGIAPSGMAFVGVHVPGIDEAAEQATHRLDDLGQTIKNLNDMTSSGSDLRRTVSNTQELTRTLKEKPWRMVWPSHKKHDKDKNKNDNESDGKDRSEKN